MNKKANNANESGKCGEHLIYESLANHNIKYMPQKDLVGKFGFFKKRVNVDALTYNNVVIEIKRQMTSGTVDEKLEGTYSTLKDITTKNVNENFSDVLEFSGNGVSKGVLVFLGPFNGDGMRLFIINKFKELQEETKDFSNPIKICFGIDEFESPIHEGWIT